MRTKVKLRKVIPHEKLSKRRKKELAAAQRGSWYGLNPVTRKPPLSRAYDRQTAKKLSRAEAREA